MELARRNAELNGFAEAARFVEANAFDFLRELDRTGERFDAVILDPPTFAKSKAHFESARRGYKEINLRGIKVVEPGGFLVTCSCSHHMPEDEFYRLILEAAADTRAGPCALSSGGARPKTTRFWPVCPRRPT